jgi:signal recognition particle subunit SEC65
MSIDMKSLSSVIGKSLRRHRSDIAQESKLQENIARALDAAGIAYRREVVLGPGERLDFLLTESEIAIEVKKEKATIETWRQVMRYLKHDSVKGCIVIAPRVEDIRTQTLSGKPIFVLPLWKLMF